MNVARLTRVDSDDERETISRKTDVPRAIYTKRVSLDPDVLTKSQYYEIEELACKMHSLDIADVSYLAFYTRLACLARCPRRLPDNFFTE